MDGSLVKKTRGGKWHERQFQVTGQELCWMKSDNKTKMSVELTSESEKDLVVEVRDVKFGLKKFAFEVSVQGGGSPQTVSLAAASENEKRAWMNAIEAAAGLPISGRAPPQRKSGRLSVKKTKAYDPSSPKGNSPRIGVGSFSSKSTTANNGNASSSNESSTPVQAEGSTAQILGLVGGDADKRNSSVDGGAQGLSDAETEAQRKLRLKLAGKLTIPVFKQNRCGVCEKTVYKMEEILVDNKSFHKRSCFRCNKCKRQLTLGNFAAVNQQLYCKTHCKFLFTLLRCCDLCTG
jgi:hypothetical protein